MRQSFRLSAPIRELAAMEIEYLSIISYGGSWYRTEELASDSRSANDAEKRKLGICRRVHVPGEPKSWISELILLTKRSSMNEADGRKL